MKMGKLIVTTYCLHTVQVLHGNLKIAVVRFDCRLRSFNHLLFYFSNICLAQPTAKVEFWQHQLFSNPCTKVMAATKHSKTCSPAKAKRYSSNTHDEACRWMHHFLALIIGQLVLTNASLYFAKASLILTVEANKLKQIMFMLFDPKWSQIKKIFADATKSLKSNQMQRNLNNPLKLFQIFKFFGSLKKLYNYLLIII